jgi:hypothetical protein
VEAEDRFLGLTPQAIAFRRSAANIAGIKSTNRKSGAWKEVSPSWLNGTKTTLAIHLVFRQIWPRLRRPVPANLSWRLNMTYRYDNQREGVVGRNPALESRISLGARLSKFAPCFLPSPPAPLPGTGEGSELLSRPAPLPRTGEGSQTLSCPGPLPRMGEGSQTPSPPGPLPRARRASASPAP